MVLPYISDHGGLHFQIISMLIRKKPHIIPSCYLGSIGYIGRIKPTSVFKVIKNASDKLIKNF